MSGTRQASQLAGPEGGQGKVKALPGMGGTGKPACAKQRPEA